MATLKDVARLACVDVSTVSRALNNTSYVHPDTKERIYAAAQELGYHPNVMAQALRQGKRHTIGVVMPRLHMTIFSQILQGIEQEARNRGYATLICVTEDEAKAERECLTRLRNGFVDGLIIAATGKNGRVLRDIQASGLPVVQILREQERRLSSVTLEFETCGYDAVKYLYDKGCREIGLINGTTSLAPYRDRYRGYQRALAQYGLTEYSCACTQPANSYEYGYDCTNQLLDDNPNIDAIMAAVDVQGLGAIRSIVDRGMSLEQVKVISLTGHAVGGMIQTSMTSMEMPAFDMGKEAAGLCIAEVEAPAGQKPASRHVTFSATLAEREST